MKLAWGKKVSPEFARKAIAVANHIGANPNHFMSGMAFETGETFSPSVRNKQSGATGLIQFMPYTAPKLGTTVEELAAMSAVEQLDYVAAYFKPWRGKLKTVDDFYMAILWPKAVGKPSTYVLFDSATDSKTKKAYLQNKGLDADKDGKVTKAEAAAKVRAKLALGMSARWVADIEDDEPEEIPTPIPPDEMTEADQPAPEPLPIPEGARVSGDPVTWSIQFHLKQLNYYGSRVDGRTGSKTFGAVTQFLTDWDERHGDITPPKTDDDFQQIKAQLDGEIRLAVAEKFIRPVSKERAELDPEVVKEIAPEAATQKKGIIATAIAAITTFFGGLFKAFGDMVGNAWNWVTGAKDALPDAVTDPNSGWVSWALHKVGNIPAELWLILGAGVLTFVAVGLIHSLRKTTDAVKTGLR